MNEGEYYLEFKDKKWFAVLWNGKANSMGFHSLVSAIEWAKIWGGAKRIYNKTPLETINLTLRLYAVKVDSCTRSKQEILNA